MKKSIIINIVGIFFLCTIHAVFTEIYEHGIGIMSSGIGEYFRMAGMILPNLLISFAVSGIIAFIGSKLFKKNFVGLLIKSAWLICSIILSISTFGAIVLVNKIANGENSTPLSILWYIFLGNILIAILFVVNSGISKYSTKKDREQPKQKEDNFEKIIFVGEKTKKEPARHKTLSKKIRSIAMPILLGIVIAFCLYLVFIFFQDKKSEIKSDIKSVVQCNKYAYYGDTKICLPEIAGMTECNSIPNVKKRAIRLLNSQELFSLAFYLPNQYYEKIDVLDEIPIDGYFIISGMASMKNTKCSIKVLDEVEQEMNDVVAKTEWKLDNTKTIEGELINIGKPVLIEKYSLNNNTRTYILLMNVRYENEEYVGLAISNTLIIKDKLIMLGSDFKYEDKESIAKAKAKNDYFVLRFFDENN